MRDWSKAETEPRRLRAPLWHFPWVMLVLQTANCGIDAGVSSAVSRALGAGRCTRVDALTSHTFCWALAANAMLLWQSAGWRGAAHLSQSSLHRPEMKEPHAGVIVRPERRPFSKTPGADMLPANTYIEAMRGCAREEDAHGSFDHQWTVAQR